MTSPRSYTAFDGQQHIVTGDTKTMLQKTKRHLDGVRPRVASVLIFDDASGRQVEFDLRGSEADMLARELPQELPKLPSNPGPGRPKLGVQSREVSLLPKHWEYLEAEPNGISAALRRLVEQAMKRDPAAQRQRLAREATARFMTVMAGDLPGFEEASRALYAKDTERFAELIRKWPKDIRKHVQRMAAVINEPA